MALSDIYQKASLVQIPSGYKSGTLYSVVPNTSSGDFTIDSDADATRVNKDGLIETTVADQARLNYDPSNPQDPHLLLEPTRTNLCAYSEQLDAIQWYKYNSVSVEPNVITSPSGALTADKLISDGSQGLVMRRFGMTTLGVTHSFSIWAKKGNFNKLAIDIGDSGNQTFTLTDEWQRVSVTATPTSNTNIDVEMPSASNGDFIYLWGAQVEAGSYPTSYIPTTTAQVTRTADTCSLPNYANLPTDYPLTVYWKGQVKEFNGFNCAFSVYKDGASGEFLVVSFNTSSQILVRRAVGGSEDVDFISYSYSLGDMLKIGIKFTSATTFKLFINGSEIYNETSGVSKTWDFNSVLIGQLRIVADTGSRNPCNELMIFNEALTDAELITLTT